MATLKEISADIRRHNNRLDGITDDLVITLERYQARYENLLLRQDISLNADGTTKRTISNFNKVQSLNPSVQLGLPGIGTKYVDQYPGVTKAHLAFNKRIGLDFSLQFKDVTIVKQFQRFDLGSLMGEGTALDAAVKKELVNIIALEAPYKEGVRGLADTLLGSGPELGRLARWADAQLRTSLFGLTRTIDKEIYDEIGETEFIYAGALDGRTRPFCRARVGKKFTNDEIEEFPKLNGSGLNGFFSPGGWRCRHSLVGTSAL